MASLKRTLAVGLLGWVGIAVAVGAVSAIVLGSTGDNPTRPIDWNVVIVKLLDTVPAIIMALGTLGTFIVSLRTQRVAARVEHATNTMMHERDEATREIALTEGREAGVAETKAAAALDTASRAVGAAAERQKETP